MLRPLLFLNHELYLIAKAAYCGQMPPLKSYKLCGRIVLLLGFAGCTGEITAPNSTEDAQTIINGSDTGATDTGSESNADAGHTQMVLGAVEGRVVDLDSKPLANLRIACCTLDLCITGETDNDGRYYIDLLDEGPRKMMIVDPSEAHLTLVYYQYVPDGEIARLANDIILPRRVNPKVTWLPEIGGTASFLGGQLTLTTEVNSLLYPPSTSTAAKGLNVERVAAENLPPYPILPWEGREADTLAFVADPPGVEASKAVVMEVQTSSTSTKTYDIWTLETKLAQLEKVGTTTITRPGYITSAADAKIKKLTTIILVPHAP